MKFRNHPMLFAAFFVITLTLLGISAAQADGFYYRYTTPLPSVTCFLSAGTPTLSTGVIPVEWNLPDGAFLRTTAIKNGVQTATDTSPVPAGTGSQLNNTGALAAAFPITVVNRFETIVGGQVVYRSTLTAFCASDGVDGTATLTNEVVSGTGGSAIADGRINPENYAPVALYCDGSVLTAYAIDGAGQGTFAWKFNVSGPSDQPLPNELGISLLRAPDVRLSVLATEADGKQYLFVFDGCPYPGATEIYVSDPVTGEMVRTD